MTRYYRPNIRTTAAQARKKIYDTMDKWEDAELVSIGEERDINQTASVVFQFRENPVRISYGLLGRYNENLHAIGMTLESIRMSYVRGLGDVLTGTVSQMLKLGVGAVEIDPYELLGIRPNAVLEVAEGAYRAMAKMLHPDTEHGDVARMKELNAAIERIRGERKVQTA